MNLNKILKGAAFAGLTIAATSANAGISTTAYLELNDLFVEIDTDNDLVPENVNPLDFITIIGGSRGTNTFANYNGSTDGSEISSADAEFDADSLLVCQGPSCGVLGLTNNGQSLDNGQLVASDMYHFAAADAQVSGSALGDGASGFTYADISIAYGNQESAAASSGIVNSINTVIQFTIAQAINLRFSALIDYFVDAVISTDIADDNTQDATASAKVTLDLSLQGGPNGVVDIDGADGFARSDISFDFPGFGDLISFSGNDEQFLSGWATVGPGVYQLNINQTSEVQASLVPAPTSLAVAALGLLGLCFTARRKKS